jgi:hypothetical protein
MKRGDKYADINDSDECVNQARKDGFHVCTETEREAREAAAKAAANETAFASMTKTQLLDLAKTNKVEIPARASVPTIITLLEKAGVTPFEAEPENPEEDDKPEKSEEEG